MIDLQNIPTNLLTDSVREIAKDIHAVYVSIWNLREFEFDSPHYAVEEQELMSELSDLESDLELELTIARSFVRGFKRKRKAASGAPVKAV
jgi:hypothetical protein